MFNHEIDVYLAHHVPLVRFMGIHLKCFDTQGLTLAAPLAPNINDKGTAFAGALAAIVTLSGWAVTYLTLRERHEKANLVIADSSIKYLRPVQEEIIAVCALPDEESVERFLATYQKRGKASWELEAIIQAGAATAVTFRGRYAAYRPV
jgi:thioesterase domain-containing protein